MRTLLSSIAKCAWKIGTRDIFPRNQIVSKHYTRRIEKIMLFKVGLLSTEVALFATIFKRLLVVFCDKYGSDSKSIEQIFFIKPIVNMKYNIIGLAFDVCVNETIAIYVWMLCIIAKTTHIFITWFDFSFGINTPQICA